MKVMKAWLSLNFLLLFLAPLTLNAEPSLLLFSTEHSATKSWTKTDPTHSYAVVEAEEKIEETSDEETPPSALFQTSISLAPTASNCILSVTSTRPWNPVLQFCSRFTNSPPLS